MLEKLIFEFQELTGTYFWVVMCLACAAAYLTKEMTGRPAYALASLPAFAVTGILGSCVMRAAELQLGVDRMTDTIVGAVTGMMILVIVALFASKAASIDKTQ